MNRSAAALIAAFFVPAAALADVPCHLVRVVDGDTFDAVCRPWPALVAETRARVIGIDAAEIRGAECAEERSAGLVAKAEVERLLVEGFAVTPSGTDNFGRVLATVETASGDLATLLIGAGLAVPYGDAGVWCR